MKQLQNRRSVRLKNHRYMCGTYFVTINAVNGKCIFGEVVNGRMCLNEFGKIVRDEWLRTEQLRNNVLLDSFIVMPNHFHGIIRIDDGRRKLHPRHFGKPIPDSLPTIIGSFKSTVTRRINMVRDAPGAGVWHRNYYEHVVRDMHDLNRIRAYIIRNPRKWRN
ncbi:transposase [Patescibacteria group bacterium]|nr:transposase [Patescibacteria group bacterium]